MSMPLVTSFMELVASIHKNGHLKTRNTKTEHVSRSMAEPSKDSMASVAEKAPVTAERKVRSVLETKLPKPYMPRAPIAPDTEKVNGTLGHKHNSMSVLQQHAAFLDQDGDGIIYPKETFAGFRSIGFNAIASAFQTFLVHAAMSYATLRSWMPSPIFPIYVENNIHRPKHGRDSGAYDTEGRHAKRSLNQRPKQSLCP